MGAVTGAIIIWAGSGSTISSFTIVADLFSPIFPVCALSPSFSLPILTLSFSERKYSQQPNIYYVSVPHHPLSPLLPPPYQLSPPRFRIGHSCIPLHVFSCRHLVCTAKEERRVREGEKRMEKKVNV